MKAKVSKLFALHNRVRTDDIVGDVISPPEIGNQLVIISEPLDKTKDYRRFNTSPIVEIDQYDDYQILLTASGSRYKYELIDDAN